MINWDEYRKVICVLTEQECDGQDCSTCEVALDHDHEIRINEHENLTPKSDLTRHGVRFEKNTFNTIAKFHPNTSIEEINTVFKFPDETTKHVPYDMRRLIIRWPQFVKMKNVLSLGLPIKMVEISSFLVAFYDHAVIVTAPRLTEEELK